jgi:hypothetical protein
VRVKGLGGLPPMTILALAFGAAAGFTGVARGGDV